MMNFHLSLLVGVLGFVCVCSQTQKFVAEVYFVADPQVIRNYMKLGYTQEDAMINLKKDARFFMFQINEYYKSLATYGLNIEIRSKAFDIMTDTNEIYDSCLIINEKQIQADVGIQIFKNWLAETGAYKKYNYDMAILWHGFDMFSQVGNNGTAGYATVGASCDSEHAVGIVEYTMTQNTAITTAHEIGHILGANHDILVGSTGCDSRLGHIMTPVSSPSNKNRWTFSHCSAQDMATTISKQIKQRIDCLRETTAPAISFEWSEMIGSDIMNSEQICLRARLPRNDPKDVFMCQREAFLNKTTICQVMYCGAHSSCGSVSPTEGFMCDVGKRCSRGKCVAAQEGFPTPEDITDSTCLYGDKNHKLDIATGKPGTCLDFLEKNVYLCKARQPLKYCCETCKRLTSTTTTTTTEATTKAPVSEDCPNGDKNPKCGITPKICNVPAGREICCATCADSVSKRSADDNDFYDYDDFYLLDLFAEGDFCNEVFGPPKDDSDYQSRGWRYPMSD